MRSFGAVALAVALWSSILLVGSSAHAEGPTERIGAGSVGMVRADGTRCVTNSAYLVADVDLEADRGRIQGASGVETTLALGVVEQRLEPISHGAKSAVTTVADLGDDTLADVWQDPSPLAGTVDDQLKALFGQSLPAPADQLPLPDQPPVSAEEEVSEVAGDAPEIPLIREVGAAIPHFHEERTEVPEQCLVALPIPLGEVLTVPGCWLDDHGTMICGDPTVSSDTDQPGEHMVLTDDGYLHYAKRVAEDDGEVRLALWISGTLDIVQDDPAASPP